MEALLSLSKGDMRRALNILQVGTSISVHIKIFHIFVIIIIIIIISFLQSTFLAYNEVSERSVYECTGQPLPTDIALIVEWMLNDSFKDAYQSEAIIPLVSADAFDVVFFILAEIGNLKTVKGLALQDILTEIHTYVHRS